MKATALSTDLQACIFRKLDEDGTLRELLGGENKIFDHSPDDFPAPYIVIGDEDVDDWNTHTFNGFQGSTELKIWTHSQERVGLEECKVIMAKVYDLLNDIDLGLPGRQQINFRFATQRILPEQDNRTYQGIMTFNFMFGGNESE